jgi:hypothetical protein
MRKELVSSAEPAERFVADSNNLPLEREEAQSIITLKLIFKWEQVLPCYS